MGEPRLSKQEIAKRILTGVLQTRSDVAGIIVFGSFARGSRYRDLDLLVVVDRLDKPPLERKDEILAICRQISLSLPIDLLLVSVEECKAGFEAHLPLFLDIAFDGRVLYDTGVLRTLIQDTRRYVQQRGITRTPTGGWRFPVAWRRSTPLSSLGNRDWANIWLNEAHRDLKAAQSLFECMLFDKCVTHCQQAAEKAGKAVLACFGVFEKTHYIASSLERESASQSIGEWLDQLRTLATLTRRMEPAVTLSRYPGMFLGVLWLPHEQYDETKAREFLTQARQALDIARDFVNWWFHQQRGNSPIPSPPPEG